MNGIVSSTTKSSLIEKRKQLQAKYLSLGNEAASSGNDEDQGSRGRCSPEISGINPFMRPIKYMRLSSSQDGTWSDTSCSQPLSSQTQSVSDERTTPPPDIRKSIVRHTVNRNSTAAAELGINRNVDGSAESAPTTVEGIFDRRKRRQRESIFIQRPLWRLQPSFLSQEGGSTKECEVNSKSDFWRGALICFWGYAKPVSEERISDVVSADLCGRYEELPLNWHRKFEEMAYEMGASLVVGADWTVFQDMLKLKDKETKGEIQRIHMCIHICRPYGGKSSLKRAWKNWVLLSQRQNHGDLAAAAATHGPNYDEISLYESIERPFSTDTNNDSPHQFGAAARDTDLPGPRQHHRIATPLWLQFCVFDHHHYPESSFVFFQPPAIGDSYTPFLFKLTTQYGENKPPHTDPNTDLNSSKTSRCLRILFMGTSSSSSVPKSQRNKRLDSGIVDTAAVRRASTDYLLWQSSVESFLGGSMFPKASLRTAAAATNGKFDQEGGKFDLGDKASTKLFILKFIQESKESISFRPFINFQGVSADLRYHNSPNDIPDVVVCFNGLDDVLSQLTTIGTTCISRLRYHPTFLSQIKLLLTLGIPFVRFGWLVDCYTETKLVNLKPYLLNASINKRVSILFHHFSPDDDSTHKPNSNSSRPSTNSSVRSSSKAPTADDDDGDQLLLSFPTSPATDTMLFSDHAPPKGRSSVHEWWNLGTDIFNTLDSPTGAAVQTAAALEEDNERRNYVEVHPANSEKTSDDDQTRLMLALSYKSIIRFPQFPTAAFSMLPSVSNRMLILSSIAWISQTIKYLFRKAVIDPIDRSLAEPLLRKVGNSRKQPEMVPDEQLFLMKHLLTPIELTYVKPGALSWTFNSNVSDDLEMETILLWLSEEKSTLVELTEVLSEKIREEFLIRSNNDNGDQRRPQSAHPSSEKGHILAARAIANEYMDTLHHLIQLPKQTTTADQVSCLLRIGKFLLHEKMMQSFDVDGSCCFIRRSHEMQRLREQQRFTDITMALREQSNKIIKKSERLCEYLGRIHLWGVRWACGAIARALEGLRPWPKKESWRIRTFTFALLVESKKLDLRSVLEEDVVGENLLLLMPSQMRCRENEDDRMPAKVSSPSDTFDIGASQVWLQPIECDIKVENWRGRECDSSEHGQILVENEMKDLIDVVLLLDKKCPEESCSAEVDQGTHERNILVQMARNKKRNGYYC